MSKKFSDDQLHPFRTNDRDCLLSRVQACIRQQHAHWPALAQAHTKLAGAVQRNLHLPDSIVTLQYNPGRTRSTTAKVDPEDVALRPCFLCPENLYPEQLALPFSPDWLILNNPFPIFKDHLVVSSAAHADQLLDAALPAMISFVDKLQGGFSAFYNGARCGASAPDHLHFQACPAGMLPLEGQLMPLALKPDGSAWRFITLDNRGIGLCSAASAPELLEHLLAMHTHLSRSAQPGHEADLNLIIFGQPGILAAAVLPRRAHRPECFFASDDEQLIISPGAVDVGGLVILPRQEDFDRMTEEKMLSIYKEVCLPADVMTAPGC
jgi:hypothetical protein